MEVDISIIIQGILALFGAIFIAVIKIVHGRIAKDIDDMKDDMKEDKDMLNNRIDRAKDEQKQYVEKTDEKLNKISNDITKILTIMEKPSA